MSQYAGVCPLCEAPLHRQALAVETPLGLAHQVCALRLEQRAAEGILPPLEPADVDLVLAEMELDLDDPEDPDA